MPVPGKNILILAAVCFSVIGGVGAYRVAQAARVSAEATSGGIIATVDTTTPFNKSENKLLSALQEAEAADVSSSTYSNPFALSDADTMTDRLSKTFFTSYAKTQTGDAAGTDDATLVNNAMAGLDVSKLPKEKYSTSDMNIIAGIGEAELRRYGNDFITLQDEKLQAIKQNPDAYKNNLGNIGTVYAAVAENLIKMPVPVSLAAEHLAIVNSFYLSAEDFKLISQQANDPVKALFGLQQYKDSVERQGKMFTDIGAYMKSNGIIFSNSEPGYFWNVVNGTSQLEVKASAE